MGTGTWRGRAAGNQSSAAADGNEGELGKALYTVESQGLRFPLHPCNQDLRDRAPLRAFEC